MLQHGCINNQFCHFIIRQKPAKNLPKTCQKPHPKTPQKLAKNPLKICLDLDDHFIF